MLTAKQLNFLPWLNGRFEVTHTERGITLRVDKSPSGKLIACVIRNDRVVPFPIRSELEWNATITAFGRSDLCMPIQVVEDAFNSIIEQLPPSVQQRLQPGTFERTVASEFYSLGFHDGHKRGLNQSQKDVINGEKESGSQEKDSASKEGQRCHGQQQADAARYGS